MMVVLAFLEVPDIIRIAAMVVLVAVVLVDVVVFLVLF